MAYVRQVTDRQALTETGKPMARHEARETRSERIAREHRERLDLLQDLKAQEPYILTPDSWGDAK